MTLLLSMPGGAEWIFIIIILGIFLIPTIFYLITLQSTLEAISFENRKMPLSNVWLLLIPLFNLVWHFFVVNALADSIKAEAEAKNIRLDESRPGYDVGLAMCILHCCSVIPVIGVFATIGGLICWIVYWVKIAGYKNTLQVDIFRSMNTGSEERTHIS